MKNKVIIFIGVALLIIACIWIFLDFNKLGDNTQEDTSNNNPKEVEDAFSIVKNVYISNLDSDNDYDFNVIDDTNKYIMIINYLSLKDKVKDEISLDTFLEASNSLFNEKVDCDNLELIINDYGFRKEGNSIKRIKLENPVRENFTTSLEKYSIEGNKIILEVKIKDTLKDYEDKGSKIVRYVFKVNNGDYTLESIKLV